MGVYKNKYYFISVYLGIIEIRVDFNILCILCKIKMKWY